MRKIVKILIFLCIFMNLYSCRDSTDNIFNEGKKQINSNENNIQLINEVINPDFQELNDSIIVKYDKKNNKLYAYDVNLGTISCEYSLEPETIVMLDDIEYENGVGIVVFKAKEIIEYDSDGNLNLPKKFERKELLLFDNNLNVTNSLDLSQIFPKAELISNFWNIKLSHDGSKVVLSEWDRFFIYDFEEKKITFDSSEDIRNYDEAILLVICCSTR